MSRLQHLRSVRWAPVVVGVSAVLALTGCSAGQVTETDTQVGAVGGGSGNVMVNDESAIAVRNATLAYPENGDLYRQGGSAPLQTVIVNTSNRNDQLVGASSPYANSVRIGGTTELPAGSTLRAFGRTNPSVQGTPSDRPTVDIAVQGLTQDIRPGVTIPVTFQFAQAGQTTVQVPIGPSPEERPDTEGEGSH